MRSLRMGIIGCGGIAQMMHLPHLQEYSERFEIAALSDMHMPTLEAVAQRFHVPSDSIYADWRGLLQRDDLDAVGIFHSGSHADTVIAALDANLHVFVEKPLGWNLREVERVAARAASSDRTVQIGYHKLYDPAYSYTRDQVQAMRDLGFVRVTVLHPADEYGWAQHRVRRGDGVIIEGHRDIGTFESQVEAQRQGLAEGPLAAAVDEALGDRKDDQRLRLAYGIMTVSLIHQTYTLFGIMGPPERVIHTDVWRDGLSIHALLEYKNNVRAAIDWHWLGYLKDYKEEYAFFGNHDRVYLTLPSPYARNFPSPVTIQGHASELTWKREVVVNYEEAFARELVAFHDNVIYQRKPWANVEEAVKHSRFLQELIDAAK